MTQQQPNDYQDKEFKLERYKYILGQIKSLNENIYKYLTLFQTLTTAIIGAGVSVFLSWRNLNITADVARLAIRCLLGLLIILGIFSITSIAIGVVSWFDYRKEEVNLLNQVVYLGFRKLPKLSNWWRWYETYIIALILIVIITVYIVVETNIIPLIN